MSDHKMSLRGDKAAVRWGYYNAAAIDRYTATRQRDGRYRLRAHVVMADAYRLKQHPLSFVAETNIVATRTQPAISVVHIWPVHEFDLSGGTMTALLGTPIGPPQW